MSSTIQIRVDDELKEKSDELFKELGTDTTTAIRMFLTQAVSIGGFPFEIKKLQSHSDPFRPMTYEEMYEEINRAEQMADDGKYRSAEAVAEDLKNKYGF